ncbi:MAG: hypothetical protein KDA72_05555 [Planctomycetales bacterium]|nr:hypothetical protein [Planctomycetales bacterium]
MHRQKSLRTPLTRSLLLLAALASTSFHSPNSLATERPTFSNTADPRPDILPHPFYYAHTEYRRAYNRPRYWSGWIADKIAANSQEAMVWRENLLAGRYDGKNCPPVYKTYYYRKPWEALQTGPRADFPKPIENATTGARNPKAANEPFPNPGIEIVPLPAEPTPPNASSRRNKSIE